MLKLQVIKRIVKMIADAKSECSILYSDYNEYRGIYTYTYTDNNGWESCRITFNDDDTCKIEYSSSYCVKKFNMKQIECALIKGIIIAQKNKNKCTYI